MSYKEHYLKEATLFEMVKLMRGKEVVFIGSEEYVFRYIKAHNVLFLKSNMTAFSFFDRDYNIYISCADFQGVPAFSYIPELRKEQSSRFNQEYKEKYLCGYDFFIDLEGGDLSYREAGFIKALFDEYKVPYYVLCSGNGFHFIIPSIYFANLFPDITNRPDIFSRFSIKLKELLNLTLIDLTIYDLRRVHKCPYSLDFKTNRIILPLSDKEFKNFNYSYVDYNNSQYYLIRDRGTLLRNKDNIKGVELLFKDILDL